MQASEAHGAVEAPRRLRLKRGERVLATVKPSRSGPTVRLPLMPGLYEPRLSRTLFVVRDARVARQIAPRIGEVA
ncbi:MAG TPA: hypothetical protein VFC04_05230 [Actinomycetota bacterium]|jgi:hypothetical protein|nr:hypothetical protein [Actinomycetota bacterium]